MGGKISDFSNPECSKKCLQNTSLGTRNNHWKTLNIFREIPETDVFSNSKWATRVPSTIHPLYRNVYNYIPRMIKICDRKKSVSVLAQIPDEYQLGLVFGVQLRSLGKIIAWNPSQILVVHMYICRYIYGCMYYVDMCVGIFSKWYRCVRK